MNLQDIGIQINKHADSQKTPIQIITQAFALFNQESNKQLNDLSSSPFFISIGNDTMLFCGYGEAINFDEIKKDGWVSTQINKVEVIYEENESALVSVDFSRMNESEIAYSTNLGHYLLIRNNNLWKLKGVFFLGGLSLGKE